ncbi:MAG: ECF-type sigma factor [Isosphaeraceae bacterium]|nr:ECF-type sigma factor [Isosphaeraceae bacterium]
MFRTKTGDAPGATIDEERGSITGPGILGLQDSETRDRAAKLLWSRFFDELCRSASKKLRSLHVPMLMMDQEDVAARAFAKVVRGIEQGRILPYGRLELLKLLNHAVRQESLNYARKSRIEASVDRSGADMADVADPRRPPSDGLLLRERIELRIESLGDEEFQRIACWKMLDYSNAEIASRLDCSLSRVERKLRLIREKLDPNHPTTSGPRGGGSPAAPEASEPEEISLLMRLILG